MVAINYGCINVAKGVAIYIPTSLTDNCASYLINYPTLSEVETLNIVVLSLTSIRVNVVNGLCTSFLQAIFTSTIWPLRTIWIVRVDWLTWFSWISWGYGNSTMLQDYCVSLSSIVIVIINRTCWEAIVYKNVTLVFKVLNG